MKKFEVGKTYTMKDGDWSHLYKVVSRTASTITCECEGSQKKFKICKHSSVFNEEFVHPYGKYSMCPSLWAGSEVA